MSRSGVTDSYSGTRVVVVAHGPPLRGGITTVALDIVGDPVLNAQFEIVFQNTTQAQDKRGAFALENVWRAITHAVDTFRLARRGAIVHTHSVQDPTLVAWRQVLIAASARLRGAKVLLHNHAFRPYMELPGNYRVGLPHRLAFRLLNRLAHANIVLSASGLANLERLMPDLPMPVLANSVVVSDFTPSTLDHDSVNLLFVGELLERKGVLVLLDALDELDRRGVGGWNVTIIGDDTTGVDPEKDLVIAEIHNRGRTGAMTGGVPREEVYRLLSEADALLMPSFVEGQPFSVIESLAAGVPVVASDIPTLAEMIPDGELGMLVAVRDSLALADALERIILDGENRRRMGSAARKAAEARYDRSVFVSELSAIYRWLLAHND